MVRHVREPGSLGIVVETIKNVPLPGSKKLPPATYQVFWSTGTDKNALPADCWYEESELKGVK